MKRIIPPLYITLILSACSPKAPDNTTKNTTDTTATAPAKTAFKEDTDSTWLNWKRYYTGQDPDFSPDKFVAGTPAHLDRMEGHVYGTFDKEFDPMYKNFLVYSPDGKRYVDIDSYHWTVEGKEIMFEPDQEINLVDTRNKTVERIDFHGPSGGVDDVYWRNDSTIILLENSRDRIPSITEIDLAKNTTVTYTYDGVLKFESTYHRQRIDKKLPGRSSLKIVP